MSETAAANSVTLPHGWLPLDRAGWWGTFAATPVNIVLLAVVPLNFSSTWEHIFSVSAWWGS
jgi:hypothetical protein